ncbi:MULTISPECIES: anthrone oxygenase family protein [unclassified Streptosporangium]|uniref:anthrone oxygenase family protein n=1 Tax=unclassified Streptosporangium TaxID=2632669 RepID=UPI003FA37701
MSGHRAVCFGGAPVLTVLAAALHLQREGRPVLPWIVAALVLYMTVLVITMGVNVPLNNALDAAGEPDGVADLAALRERFEAVWVRWNLARTVACVAAFGCLTWALVLYGRIGPAGGS